MIFSSKLQCNHTWTLKKDRYCKVTTNPRDITVLTKSFCVCSILDLVTVYTNSSFIYLWSLIIILFFIYTVYFYR